MILPLQSRRYRYYCSQASKMHFLSPGWSCLQTAVASSSSGVYCETLLPTWMGSQWAGTQCHPVATTGGSTAGMDGRLCYLSLLFDVW